MVTGLPEWFNLRTNIEFTPLNLNLKCAYACSGTAEIAMCIFYSIFFVQFMQFPVLDFGLASPLAMVLIPSIHVYICMNCVVSIP